MDLTKIYGVEFDEAVLRGGKNAFDYAYPFGAMQLCNVSYGSSLRHVICENESGFIRRQYDGGNPHVLQPPGKEWYCGTVGNLRHKVSRF